MSGEDDREFEMRSGTDDIQFMGPGATEGSLPEDFDGAEGLVDGGVGELFDGLEVNKVRLDLLEGEKIGRAVEMLSELTDAGEVGVLGAGKKSGQNENLLEGDQRRMGEINRRRFFYS